MTTFKVTYKTIKSNARKTMYAEANNDIEAMNICSANFLGAIPLYAEVDDDKLTTTQIRSLGVSLDTYYLGDKLGYKMYINGILLFEGDDFKPSPLRNIDDLETNIDLLSFLSTGIHDTDSEYFANYNQHQLDWANDKEGGITIREQLSGIVGDASDKSSEYYKDANKKFTHKQY